MSRKILICYFSLLFSFLASVQVSAQAYSIQGQLQGLPSELSTQDIHLAYYFGDNQYIKETSQISPDGKFSFSGDSALAEGFYMVVMPFLNMNYFDLLINNQEQDFSLSAHVSDPISTIEFKGSKENTNFYEYLNYLQFKRGEFGTLVEKLEQAQANGQDTSPFETKMESINAETLQYQLDYVDKNKGLVSAAVIKASIEPESPEFLEDDSVEEQARKFYIYRQHFFDNLDLSDDRLIRSPILFQKVNEFVVGNNYGIPDSISKAIDIVLEPMARDSETFKFFLVHYLNKYANSKIVGMDAVYVHLALEYYAKGSAPWSTDEELDKIIANGKKLEPLLIGKKAPNLHMEDREGEPISLYEVNADYTVLYFWRYDCDVCQESQPEMQAFYDEFKDQNVKIFSVCTKYTDEIPPCWEYIDNNNMGEWVNVVDPLGQSRYNMIYDVQVTPQIYVLDKYKTIVSKRIGTEQLPDVLRQIMTLEK